MTSPIIYFFITPYNHPPFIHCIIGPFKIKQNEITDFEEKERGEEKSDSHTTTPSEGEDTEGDEPGYTPTQEDIRLREVYGDWVHNDLGTHLDGGIHDDSAWQAWRRDLAVMLSRHYDMLSGRVGRRFVRTLGDELRGVRDRLWNSERFIVFQTVILQ